MIIETKLERTDYLKLMFLMIYRKPATILMTVIGIVMLLGSLVYFLGFRGFYTDPPYFQGVLGFLIVFLIPFSILRSSIKNFSRNGRLQEKLIYEFTDDKIKIIGSSFKTEMDWSKIYKIKELKNWMLIYQDKQLFNVIPKASFGANLNEFKTLVRSKNIRLKLRK